METDLVILRRRLAELADEFGQAAGEYPVLRHQWVWGDRSMRVKDWRAFFRANTRGVEWQAWEAVPGRMRAARFSGFGDGMSEYARMAEEGFDLLLRAADLAAHGTGLPPGSRIDLPKETGVHGWTEAVYLTARHYATAALSERSGYWGVTGESAGDEDGQWTTTPDGERYPDHPAFEELLHDVFLSSAEAIRLWLEPDGAVTVGEVLERHPCVVLPDPGRAHAPVGVQPPVDPVRPVWTDSGQLWVGRRLVKHYRQPADNQRRILSAFEEEGWPARIDDPLPGCADLDPKRRLRDTVEALNDHHKAPGLVRFEMDGTGTGVVWRLGDAG